MNYVRSFFLNFLIVFFINRVAPGVEIQNFEQVPNIGADLFFSLVVGFLNASVYFVLALFETPISNAKLGIYTFLISFIAFILIAIFPFGVRVVSPFGVIIGGGVVWVIAFMTNHLEWKYYRSQSK